MGRKSYDLWVDLANTPQVHVLVAIVRELRGYSIYVTGFKRGETAELMRMYGLNGEVFGSDNYNPLLKSLSFASRTFRLLYKAPRAKVLLSFENAMPIPAGKLREIKTILMLDNDLKLIGKKPLFQKIESRIKKMADIVMIPKVAEDIFSEYFENVVAYPGYKEHIYIADFQPDPDFLRQIPFEEYVVLRPESLTSLYVLHNKSLVPELLRLFERESINVVYLPRNEEEKKLARGFRNVYIPPKALDGLNLIYHSKATLTGSGTMAREAAVMGVPAISFFPGERLLAVDGDLVEREKMLHSRDAEEILDYVLENWKKARSSDIEKARKVKGFVIEVVKKIVEADM
jgi:predicted glycosyltransferase